MHTAHHHHPHPDVGGITPRNVDLALLYSANTSLTTSSARVGPAGRHAGGSGGCARDNGKGAEERLSMRVFVCARLTFLLPFVLGGSFNSPLITYAIGSSEMLAPQKD